MSNVLTRKGPMSRTPRPNNNNEVAIQQVIDWAVQNNIPQRTIDYMRGLWSRYGNTVSIQNIENYIETQRINNRRTVYEALRPVITTIFGEREVQLIEEALNYGGTRLRDDIRNRNALAIERAQRKRITFTEGGGTHTRFEDTEITPRREDPITRFNRQNELRKQNIRGDNRPEDTREPVTEAPTSKYSFFNLLWRVTMIF